MCIFRELENTVGMFIGGIEELVETVRMNFPMKQFVLLLLIVLMTGCGYAGTNKNTWDYPFLLYDKYKVNGSKTFYRFETDLRTEKKIFVKSLIII